MKILVLNCGSSSLKYQLFNMETKEVLAKGIADRIGIEGSNIKHKSQDGNKIEIKEDLTNHTIALEKILELIVDEKTGSIKSLKEINAVGHRVVHGGEFFNKSVLITAEIKQKLKDLIPLAPLHNPANIMGIEACEKELPGIPNIGVFDTAFHQTMNPISYIYAIPYRYYEKYKIRRYGFHGTSHKYVSAKASEFLGKDIQDLKIITCHVGNGASITAINGGNVIDTSMGFTPLEGLVMGTRCGDIDPAIVNFLAENEKISTKEIDKILNKESGVLGISGISSDMREIEDGHIAGNTKETLALDIYVNRIIKYIGSYNAILNGCDAVVLTAGVLENSAYIRKMIADKLGWLGIKLDESNNNFRGEQRIISTSDSKVKLIVIPTDEEYMIAKDTYEIIK